MGLWIAENSYTRSTTVGGTAVLDDRNSTSHVEAAVTDAAAGLKRNKDGLVLVPQPSDDPRDREWPPLRFSASAFLGVGEMQSH